MAPRHPHSFISDQPARRGAGLSQVFTLRRSTLAVQAAWLVGLGAGIAAVMPSQAYAQSTAQQDADTKRSYAISAGPLSRTLAEFASAAGVELVVDGELLKGRNSNGLGGSYTVYEGFSQLLQGQGLNAVRHANGSYTLSRQAEAAAAGTALPVVTVTGAAPSLVTEGTGRYTTGKTASATGLALKARETPQTLSVMTRQQLDDMGVQSIQEILHNAPGMTVSQLDSERFTFYSRGFAIDHFQYDGVPTQFTTQYGAGETEVDSILYDRVEIVRGATGLMTGAGNPSASINLVRKHANSKVFMGTLVASAASWDNYRVSADLSTPLSEDGRIRGRVVAADEKKHSYVNGYSRERQTFYGVIDADLTAETSLSVGASYARGRAKGVTYGGFPLVYSNGSAIDLRSLGRSFSIWPEWSTENTDSTNVFGQLGHEWSNGWKTSLLAMYSKQKVENTRLFLWGFPDATTGLLNSNPSRVKFPGARDQSSIDIKNAGPFQAFGRTHEAIIGVSYSKQVADFDRAGASDAVPAVSFFNWANYPEPASWGASVKSETYDRRQTGVYGALRLSLADPLKLIVGGRYNRWQRSGAGYMGRSSYDMTQTKVTPYAGLVLDLGDNYSLYGSYTSIYNPQNYRNRGGEFLDPIKGHNLETGIKGEFLDGRVQAAVAVFQIKQDNVAQADAGYLVPGTTTQAYVGAQGVTSKGVEFEVSGELASGWNLAFNAAHFKSTDATGADVNTASARTTAHLFTTYRLPGAWQKLTVGGGANWQSKTSNVTGVYQANNPNGVGTYQQGGYLLANLMARYQFTPKTSLQFNIDNLFDKWYYAATDFGEQLMWGAPRSYRATLTYQF